MSIAEISVPRIRILAPGRRLLRKADAHRFLVIIVLVASTPAVVAFLRAVLHGWWPQGDDAVVALKVWDVFHGHPPLMGMRSTSGVADPELSTHHPGPLEFYVLSVPAALAGFRPIGLLIGTTLIAMSTLAAIAVVGFRRGGRSLAVLLLAAAIAVQWAVGPETLFRPLNPYPALLPVLLLLTLAWSLLEDDLSCMWGYVLTASFVAQAHVAYAPLVAAVTLVLAVVGLVRWRQRRDAIWPRPGWRPVHRSRRDNPGRRALIVLILCWLPVLIETLRFDPNNLTQMVRYLSSDPQSVGIGWQTAAKLVTGQLAPIPGGFSPLSLDNGPFYSGTTVAAQVAGSCLAATLLALVVGRGRWPLPPGMTRGLPLASALALLGLITTCASLALIPVSDATPRYFIIGLWPVVGFAWAVLAWAVVGVAGQLLASPGRSPRAARLLPTRALPVVLLATGAVLACFSPVGIDWRSFDRIDAASAAVAEHVEEMGEPERPVRIEAGGWVGWLTLSPTVAYRLRVAGHPVFVPSLWPYPQDDDFRRLALAPADSIHVRIREQRGSAWYGPEAGSTDSLAATFPIGTDGRVDVFVERLRG